MRRSQNNALCSILFSISIIICTMATPSAIYAAVTFNEVFLGDDSDNDYFAVWKGYTAEFNFNLTKSGDTAKLYGYDRQGNYQEEIRQGPTTDVNNFIVGAYNIDSAILSITISSEDRESETVTVTTGINDGDQTIEVEYFLPDSSWKHGGGHGGGQNPTVESATLSIDLANYNGYDLREFLEEDGIFQTLVMALNIRCDNKDNDFAIEQVSLYVEATAVPIPGAVWFLGTGLVACFPATRKKLLKK